jgi:hypothetical protein
VGGEAVWCGQEEWGRGAEGCRCGSKTQRPRGTRAGLRGAELSAGRGRAGVAVLRLGRVHLALSEELSLSGALRVSVLARCLHFPGSGRPGPGRRQRRPPETARGRSLCRGLRAGSGRWYLLSSARTPSRSLAPFRSSPEPGKPRRGPDAGPSSAQSRTLGGVPRSTKAGVYSQPSRSGKGHQSLESGVMLKAAALPCRPQALFSQSPTSSGLGFISPLPARGLF